MTKTELICDACDSNVIIVTQPEESLPQYCPICSSPIPDQSELQLEGGEE